MYRRGGGIINSIKVIKYLLVLIFIFSISFNLFQKNQIKNFKVFVGAEYQSTVRNTIFDLDAPSTFWLDELKKENGDVLLERYIGELEANADNFVKINGKLDFIGDQLHYLSNLYWDLEKAVNDEDTKKTNKLYGQIEELSNFVVKVLKDINDNLGENQFLWYKELSNPDSKTSNQYWDELKEFERNTNK